MYNSAGYVLSVLMQNKICAWRKTICTIQRLSTCDSGWEIRSNNTTHLLLFFLSQAVQKMVLLKKQKQQI